MRDLQKYIANGGLNLDDSPEIIINGDYTDALNIRHLTEEGESEHKIHKILGNKFAFEIPEVTTQNKIYRIPTKTDGNTHILTFKTQNGVIFAIVNFAEGTTVAATQANLISNLNVVLSGLTIIPPQSFTTTNQSTYTTLELTTLTGFDYSIVCSTLDLVIQQEAINLSLAGKQTVIGSKEILEDLFVFNTPQDKLPEKIDIDSMKTHQTLNVLCLKTTEIHLLQTGDSIITENIYANDGSTDYDWLNGEWIVEVINDYEVYLYYHDKVTYPHNITFSNITYGNIIKYSKGIGEIGIATYNIQNDTFTYTRLLRSKELNFNANYQIDVDGEYSNNQVRLYLTDNNNPPMAFYHKGSYSNDCALEINGGIYNYGKIAEKIKLFISKSSAILTFIEQSISGGNIASGNWRYTIRLLDENLVKTDCLDLSNPIPAYTKSPDNPNNIIGDKPGVSTPKQNKFQISNIDTKLYKYVELIGINYVGEGKVGYLIKREEITGETMLIQHTGFEASESLDFNEVNTITVEYETVKNIRIINNRLVGSNLTLKQIQDFSNWAKTFKHSIKKKLLKSCYRYGLFEYGEYQKPENVHFYLGYMHNETYRFGIKVKLKIGNNPYTFWVDDIKIDISAINLANPTDNRRIIGLSDYSLNISKYIYSTYIEFSNINLDYLIDGVKIRDLIDSFSFVRVECIPEILATGISIMGVKNVCNHYFEKLRYNEYDSIGEYPFFNYNTCNINPSGICKYPNGPYYSEEPEFTACKTSCFFYSPDIIYGYVNIDYNSGDKLINVGMPVRTPIEPFPPFINPLYYDPCHKCFAYGEHLKTDLWTHSPETINIKDAKKIYKGLSNSVAGKDFTTILKFWNTIVVPFNTYYELTHNMTSLAIETETDINDITTNGIWDQGLRYCQYFREKPNKYGNKNNSHYVPTGHYYKITDTSPSMINNENIFGGDTFTQKTYIKNRINVNDVWSHCFTNGFAFYSQNRINTQLRVKEFEDLLDLFPSISLGDWLDIFTGGEGKLEDQYYLNLGYRTANEINSFLAYNPDLPYTTERKNVLIWSEPKLIDSYVDNFRIFKPLSFKSLDLTNGEIIHHEEFNGELISWQIERIERQYFTEKNTLVAKEGFEIQLGDPGIMARAGFVLSSLGCQHKWSIIKGKTEAGNDIIGWINQKHKMAFKLSDRIYCISNRKVRNFFNKNLKWVTKDTPAAGLGICGVWNGEHSELIWTIRARKECDEVKLTSSLIPIEPYNKDDLVWWFSSSEFAQTPFIYKSLKNNNSAPLSSTSWWERIPHTNKNYYNEFSIVFSEFKDRFVSFLTILPKIYLQWRDTYLVPSPSKHINKVYRNNKGNLCEWFKNNSDVITAKAFIEGIINKHSSETKYYATIDIDNLPKRVEFTTKNHISYLNQDEFEEREDKFLSPIKEDSTTSGVNFKDTGLLWGKWLKVKIILIDKVFAIIVNFRLAARLVSK